MRFILTSVLTALASSLAAQNMDSLWAVYNNKGGEAKERMRALHRIVHVMHFVDNDSSTRLGEAFLSMAREHNDACNIGLALRDLGTAADIDGRNEDAIGLYRKAIKAYQMLPDSSGKQGIAAAYNNMGIIYKNMGDYASAHEQYELAMAMHRSIGDSGGVMFCHGNIGRLHMLRGEFDSALVRYRLSNVLAERSGNKRVMAMNFGNMGAAFSEMGLIALALEHKYKAMNVFESIGDQRGVALSLSQLSSDYTKQGDYRRAIDMDKKALTIASKVDYKSVVLTLRINIGSNLLELSKPDSALLVLDEALSLQEELDAKDMRGTILIDIGQAYEALGETDKAEQAYREAVVFSSDIGDKDNWSSALASLGSVLLKRGKAKEAIKYCSEGLEIASRTGGVGKVETNCDCLYRSYKAMGDGANTFRYFEMFIAARDSSANMGNVRSLVQHEMIYAFQKKQLSDSLVHVNQITLLENEKTIEHLRAARNRNRTLGFAGGAILLLAGGTAFYISDRKRRERKKALIQEQAVNTRLRQLDKLKDQFLANTSHELRTPLNGIIGLSESLYQGVAGEPTDRMKENLSMIISSGRRLASLINDILDFSKLREKDITLALRPVDLKTIVEVDLRIMQPATLGKDLRLVNEIPRDIPAVIADENRLQQILLNLVGNSVKFTAQGSVTVSAREENGMVAISVTDTGIGIPAGKLKDIFIPFEQADASAQRQFGGTGLGLTITKQLVELHGGTLSVQSVEGEGTTFTFTLPVSMENAVAPAPGLSLSRQRIVDTPVPDVTIVLPEHDGAFRILVVDDEPVNRQVVANYLTNGPFELRLVSSGAAALKAVEESTYDLVLLDVMMPGMTGYEVCQRLREKYLSSELPVIMLTAHDQVNDLVEGFNTGANDYLIKPVSRLELLARIKTHLNLLKINTSFSRFVPRDFLRSLGKENILEVKLGDQIKADIAVMFADIRSYTTLSESMTVDQNFRFLNSFLGRVGPVIQQHNGFVNQFLGDGLMALFQHHPENALKAAIDMQKVVAEHNRTREIKGRLPVQIGIGVHYGPLMMGIIGDDKRMDAGVVSDTVNTASRVEGLTKYYGASILLSQDTVDRIDNLGTYHHRSLGKVMMKGKRASLAIHEFFDGQSQQVIDLKEGTKSQLEQGLLAYYEQRFTDAAGFFKKVTEADPKDLAAQIFLRNCATYMVQGVPPDWAGVEEMTSK